ncbi:MltA domain-containing protein [Croceibacterium sp. LX-88]|uniref:peptidoglycan lytic exotransglycosylase n=1 Tax=Croceibacterium selenioxidans TaxID=2838833 RepID=A0ABS5W7I8_9SPHN|nr:MltA domain-containing protein [Croceibacterium selenioxidans]
MPGGGRYRFAGLATLALLAGCVAPRIKPSEPRPTPSPPPVATNAYAAGVRAGPAISDLQLSASDARGALTSFRESCPKLLARTDGSGLTRKEDWQEACTAASGWSVSEAPRFFETQFEAVIVGEGASHVTGYFEPEIAGSRQRRPGFEVPVYRMPPDLVRDWPSGTPAGERNGRPPLGRRDERGVVGPYFDRGQIEDGALAGKGLEIAWAADPIEFFFLQIQGSGRLRTPEGEVIRIGYAGQNGRAYVAIGSLMRQRGLIGSGPGQYSGSMQGIVQYLRDHPAEGRAVMRENQSWVFFRELTGDGPLGALEVPVRRENSVAADPAFVPLGAPVFINVEHRQANGLWIAQDTGGAIKGANRFDTFWGAGNDAQTIAGGMNSRGKAFVLLPKGTLARLRSQ